MDIRTRFPKSRSAIVVMNLKQALWDEVLANPLLDSVAMKEIEHRLHEYNKIIKRRTIPIKLAGILSTNTITVLVLKSFLKSINYLRG